MFDRHQLKPVITKSDDNLDSDLNSGKGQKDDVFGMTLVLLWTPPLTHSHAEVIVLTSACLDNSVAVGLCAQICLQLQ